MKTLFAIILLAIFAMVAGFLAVFILNLAGLPGALLAGKPGARSKARFVSGSIISAIGQSFVALGYVAFIVGWTRLAITYQKITIALWAVAFLAVVVPLWQSLVRARLEDRETQHANAQVEALHITVLVGLIGFFVFAFFPTGATIGYGWVPYVR